MNEQWMVLTRGGGNKEKPDQTRVCGPFSSEEAGWEWLVAKFGEGVMEACADYLNPQVIQVETPDEF